MNHQFMDRAIELSLASVNEHRGGPFGCVIVKDGCIISEGWNQVTNQNDPTAHAEIVAIRHACKKLGVFRLQGCQIYTSCEPCPMCLSAIYWAHIDTVYFGNTKTDAAQIGFDDAFIYQELDLDVRARKLPMIQLLPEKAIQAFEAWKKSKDKIVY